MEKMCRRLFIHLLVLCLLLSACTGPGESRGSQPSSDIRQNEPTELMGYTVTFMDGSQVIEQQSVLAGNTVSMPKVQPEPGYGFGGWFTDPAFSGGPYDFSQPVGGDLKLYLKLVKADAEILYSYAGYECAALEWEETDPASCRVGYRMQGKSDYFYVDAPLIRAADANTARVDILGLQGGKTYDFLICASTGECYVLEDILISSYDRSGYAHFGYTQGVGAYEDSGQLKEGALVLYLTEENKNDILDSAYVNGKKVDISPYMKDYSGIGQLLNNRRYNGSDRFDVGIAKLCQVYGAVTIRILGTVKAEQNPDKTSTILGLTDYNSRGNGGAEGDNGRMARMVNAKNLTVEGVGEDACMDGWGIHFISDNEGNIHPGAGESLEVRNISFRNYPEDAVGMEGQQGDGGVKADLTSPVQRCWIHHNTFYPGYCENPAESDKAQGDGSCDFKRGRFYTLSYNHFVDCHKTNLIGSGDTSLQYDISFHHNFWENCGSRMPLLRNANFHFYNNYVFCDVTDQDVSLGYVASVRANSFMLSENNYFSGCKNVVQVKSGGTVKAYGNAYYACFDDDDSVQVESRQAEVENKCGFAFRNIDYSAFDTDPTLFYYDAENGVSDCYLTDAYTARLEVLAQAGTQKRKDTVLDVSMNQFTPEGCVTLTDGALSVDFGNIGPETTLPGIRLKGSSTSGTFKGKGQVVTFTLYRTMQVHICVRDTGKPDNRAELLDSTGKLWAGKFTEFSGVLPAGIYIIASGRSDKEIRITELIFRLPKENG